MGVWFFVFSGGFVSGCSPYAYVLGEVLSVFLFFWWPFWLRVYSFVVGLWPFGYKFLFIQKRKKKLKLRWSGPYTVAAGTHFGAVILKTNSGDKFKVNGQRLKHYLGGRSNEEESQI